MHTKLTSTTATAMTSHPSSTSSRIHQVLHSVLHSTPSVFHMKDTPTKSVLLFASVTTLPIDVMTSRGGRVHEICKQSDVDQYVLGRRRPIDRVGAFAAVSYQSAAGICSASITPTGNHFLVVASSA